jgi:GTP-binding protein
MQFKEAKYICSYVKFADIPNTGLPEVAFAGRSNVGKSTLINKVLNRKKLVQVSNTPGKTKALNYFEVDGKYHFVDLPGCGYAKVAKSDRKSWGKLIETFLQKSPNLKGLIHIIDSRRGVQDIDWTLIEFMSYINSKSERKVAILFVLSKSDKLKAKARSETYKEAIARLGCDPSQLLFFSAISGQGLAEIRNTIMEMLNR